MKYRVFWRIHVDCLGAVPCESVFESLADVLAFIRSRGLAYIDNIVGEED